MAGRCDRGARPGGRTVRPSARPQERELARDLGQRGTAMTTPCRRQPDGSWRLIADYDFLYVASMHISPVVQDSPEQGESTG